MRGRFGTAKASACLIGPPAVAVIVFAAYALLRFFDSSPTKIFIVDVGNSVRLASASRCAIEPGAQLGGDLADFDAQTLGPGPEFGSESFGLSFSLGGGDISYGSTSSFSYAELAPSIDSMFEEGTRSGSAIVEHSLATATAVPEPAAGTLLLLGMAAVILGRRRTH